MENNFGKINTIFLQNSESLLNTENGVKVLKEYIKKINSSDLLKKQYSLYESIEGLDYSEDVKDYLVEYFECLGDVDKKLLSEETNNLHELLVSNGFIGLSVCENEKLYESINNLIYSEKSIKNVPVRVNSINSIVEHIKNNKPQIVESVEGEKIKLDEISLQFILNRFNKNYSDLLNENEESIFKTLVSSDDNKKIEFFESLNKECLGLTNNMLKENIDNTTREKLLAVKESLLENKYEQKTLIDDVVRLLDLKETLSGL
jgi:succinate dehydrogenase flavin-adding protein (antitoxin of CptAB toxin-antitoxin module)